MKLWYWLIFLVPRLICVITSNGLFSRDGTVYLQQAQDIAHGDAWRAFSHAYPPLYSFLISIFIKIGLAPVTSGMLVSLLASALTAYCLYKICSHLFDEKAGFLAFVIYSFHVSSIYFSVDIISDSLYGSLLISSLCCMTLINENNSKIKNRNLFILSAICVGLCASTRGEGLFLWALLLFYIFITEVTWTNKFMKVSFFSVIILICMLPYIWVTYKLSGGEFHLSAKYNLWSILGVSDYLGWDYKSGHPYRWLDPLIGTPEYTEHLKGLTSLEKHILPDHSFSLFTAEVLDDLRKLFGPFILLGSVILLTIKRHTFKEKSLKLFFIAMAVMLAIVLLNFTRSHYVAHRHYYGFYLCLIPVLACAFRPVNWSEWKKPLTIVMILFIAYGTARSLKNPHRNKAFAKEIGLQCRSYKHDAMMCTDGRVAYFAGKNFIYMPPIKSDFKTFIKHRRKFIHLIVLHNKDKALVETKKNILLELGYKQKGEHIFYDN